MRVTTTGGGMLILGSFLALTLPGIASSASAASTTTSSASRHAVHHVASAHTASHGDYSTAGRREAYVRQHGHIVASHGRTAGVRQASARTHGRVRYAGISCVPYARSESGINVAGNAWQWWDNAAGVYARGSRPEPGSVLSFESNGRMRLGHVAVVSHIVNAREIEVDQANWWGPGMRGGVSHDMPVVDVSENNDWTAVRVGLGHSGEFGSVYPTNGFIYDRPDNGTMVAAVATPAPKPALNPAPADLRSYAERASDGQGFDEVAEAPMPRATARHHVTHKLRAIAQK
jgi:surface antigen